MKKLLILVIVLLFCCACQDSHDTGIGSMSESSYVMPAEKNNIVESDNTETSSELLEPSNSIAGIVPKHITVGANINETDLTSLYIRWADDSVAFLLDSENLVVMIIDTQASDVIAYDLAQNIGSIRNIRVINGNLLLSTSTGFYLVDANGTTDEVFVYENEQSIYSLPLDALCSEYISYSPVISDNLQYIAFFHYAYNDLNGGESIPSGSWEIVIIDRQSGTCDTFMHEDWLPDPENEAVIGMNPIAFSSENAYLYFDYAQLLLMPYDYCGGRINMVTKEIEIVDNEEYCQTKKIIDDNTLLVFAQGPPSFRIDNIYVFSFVSKVFSVFEDCELKNIAVDAGELYFYMDENGANIANYKIQEYAQLYTWAEDIPDFNFQDVSNDGKLIGSNINNNGDYFITILNLKD